MEELDIVFLRRAVRFLHVAAGEGIWFRDEEVFPDELDAAAILYEWIALRDGLPDWFPEELKKDYK